MSLELKHLKENTDKYKYLSKNTDKYKYLSEKTTYHIVSGSDEYEVEATMREFPDEIKLRLDNLYGALCNGIELCEKISESKELSEISKGHEEWFLERLEKALGVMDELIYECDEWDFEEEYDEECDDECDECNERDNEEDE